MLNVVDGCMPSNLGTGQDDLHLMLPQRFFTHGQNRLGDRQAPRIDVAAKMRGMWRQKDPTYG